MNYMNYRHLMRQSDLTALIESACQSLEISSSQNELARKRYGAVGDWLSRADDPLLATIAIQLQGSVAIGTTVKPIGTNEYDVDLMSHVGDLDVSVSPASLKKSIGDRLRSNGTYADLLEEMPRCWRLNYANEFHLDITPSISKPVLRHGRGACSRQNSSDLEGVEPARIPRKVRTTGGTGSSVPAPPRQGL